MAMLYRFFFRIFSKSFNFFVFKEERDIKETSKDVFYLIYNCIIMALHKFFFNYIIIIFKYIYFLYRHNPVKEDLFNGDIFK